MITNPTAPCPPPNWAESFFGPHFIEIFSRLGKFANAFSDVDAIIQLLGLPQGATILDIPCGFGRHSAVLYAKGYRVVGVDSSPFLLSEAKRTNPGPEYILSDMRLPPQGSYSAALNLWTSFGYFATREEDIAALRAWHDILQPSGQLIMELSDLERSEYENPRTNESTTYKRRIVNGVTEEAWIDWPGQTAVVSYALDERCIIGRTRIYSQRQLQEMLLEAGFKDLQFYGGFDKRKKTPADRVVIHAKK